MNRALASASGRENDTGDSPECVALRQQVAGTNIEPETLLATDYLNHFNEIVMMLEMVPDMPELLEEAKAWEPKSYTEFVAASGFSHRDLAVAAYAHVPRRYKKPFEMTVAQLDGIILLGVRRLEKRIAEGDTDRLRADTDHLVKVVHALIERASSIIHGADRAMDQNEIDTLLQGGDPLLANALSSGNDA